MALWLETDSNTNVNISSATAVGAYTATRDVFVLPQLLADQVAGSGDYVYYVTLQIAGAGTHYVMGPKTTQTAAAGETGVAAQGGLIFMRNGDVMTVYIDGLAGDTATPDVTVRFAAIPLPSVAAGAAGGLPVLDSNLTSAANVTYQAGMPVAAADAGGNVPAVLANTAHGGLAATLRLSKLSVIKNEPYHRLIEISNSEIGGVGIYVNANSDIVGDLVGTIERLAVGAQGDVRDAVGLAAANLDTQLAGMPTDMDVQAATAAAMYSMAQPDWRSGETQEGALADLYNSHALDAVTGNPTTLAAEGGDDFAAWAMQELDGALFVGVGRAPTVCVAGVIGALDSIDAATTPVFEYALPEEGVSAMCAGSDGKLYVAGVDERKNTNTGSIYIRSEGGAWTRKHTLTNWVHVYDVFYDGILWVAGQGLDASIARYSLDGGDTWTTFNTNGRGCSIRRMGTLIVMTTWDGFSTYDVQRTSTATLGVWHDVAGLTGGYGRLIEWQDRIIGSSIDNHVWAVDSGGAGTSYDIPFTLAQTYNNLAVDTQGYLCALAEDGVWRTADLATWRKVWTPATGAELKALAVFGDDLVVAVGGTNAVTGADAAIYARPASPEYAAQRLVRNAMALAAPGAGAEAGSIDAHLETMATTTASILEDTGATLPAALVGIPAATEALLASEHGSGVWDNGVTKPQVYTVTVAGAPIAGVRCRMHADAGCTILVSAGMTNDAGQVVFWHSLATDATVYITRQHPGYVFSDPDVEVIP